MEFWGVEVKAKQTLKVVPEGGKLVHISQAAIGEFKDVKGPKNVPLRMTTDDNKYIIGTLSTEDRPQLMFDLVFEKEFALSHDLEKGSVYFMGYIADDPANEEEDFSDEDGADYSQLLQGEEASDGEEEALPTEAKENGTVKVKVEDVKPAAGKAKKEAKKEEKVVKKEVEDSDDDDEEDSDFDSDDEMAVDGSQVDSSDISGDDDSDEDSEDDSSEEEEPPKELPKGKQGKKRQPESAEKSPAAKKAKSATPDKTGKKVQKSNPTPSKSAGKTPNKPNQQTPKSGGQTSGKSFTKPISSGKGKHGRK